MQRTSFIFQNNKHLSVSQWDTCELVHESSLSVMSSVAVEHLTHGWLIEYTGNVEGIWKEQ